MYDGPSRVVIRAVSMPATPISFGYECPVNETGKGMTETPSTVQGDQFPEWNINDLHSYGAGTIVRHHGHTYRAKPYPASERTRQAECEPGGSSAHPVAWMDAWIRID